MLKSPSFYRQSRFCVCFMSFPEMMQKYENMEYDLGIFSNVRKAFYYPDEPEEPIVFIRPDKEFLEGRIKE